MASKLLTARAAFEAANLEAARIIAADPERYPAGSLMAIWADMVLHPPAKPSRAETGRPA